jgi:DNA adenine methylase
MPAPRPFLKWAGGKTRLLPELRARVPKHFTTYREPFLGGGALFFELHPMRAVLSDWNAELVTTYCAVRDRLDGVIFHLGRFSRLHCAELYDHVRAEKVDPPDPAYTAARMIYLNKTCFNGLYRVNSDGVFNAPMGKFKTPPTICDAENLRACSEALRYVEIHHWDFQYALRRAERGDFVYCDPPYLPSSATADFTSYTADGFALEDHEALAWSADRSKLRGARVLISSAGNPQSRQVYRDFDIQRVTCSRAINSKSSGRGAVDEFLCT